MNAATETPARRAVLDAAADLLREVGADGLTTRAIADAAGVQAPTLYRLFGDKDGLVDALAEHVMAAYVAAKTERAADEEDEDPVVALRDAWRAHVDFGLANPALYALLGRRQGSERSPGTLTGIEVLRRRVGRVAAAGRLRVDEERAVWMVHAAGHGTVLALLGVPPDERDPGLPDAMYDALAAALLRSAPVVEDATPQAVAVTMAAVLPDLDGLSAAERALMAEWLGRVTRVP
ncbi:TetR/AcrR family transcriptional regulator [Nocardioides sp. CFH 31398]|uniref:TetR/AcrR family transcriptional regulator n=1 Tax=Nocardioides sp. CFH 31398 TaxID=2919579 RepID=UPI001F056DE3|nr:TetR/AcrR family transcriptional regulator [Nocardioides sp. CFH 31398]MCH1865064.1 TetR/AcrR family transcriptional regulator [Nocardioides sp. CFH 31398]